MNNSSLSLSASRFFPFIIRRNLWIMVLADICAIFLAHYLSYCFRFEFAFNYSQFDECMNVLWWMVPVKILTFSVFGMYKGMWRYTGISDMINLVKANTTASAIVVLVILAVYRFQGYSRSVFIIDLIMTFILTSSYRVIIRMYFDRQNGQSDGLPLFKKKPVIKTKRILIIGAGDAGEKTLREILGNQRLSYEVVGFIDDDSKKKSFSIHNVPVLGGLDLLKEAVSRFDIDELLIAMPSATGQQKRHIVKACEECEIPFKTLPGLGELIDGKVSIKALRDVNYEDLLGRPPVQLNTDQILEYLHQKVVLVTGPGGSIGSELCRQIVRYNPLRLILMDASEPNLYDIQMELKHRAGYPDYVTVLGAVQNQHLVRRVFEQHRPDVVFHAAAYKHVPMLERNPWQAVWNNIRGTHTMLEMAAEYQVGRFILVSTDKAVRPTNVMGASKRCCEQLMNAYAGNGVRMMAVRFGNVVGSSGSVVPLFRKQIEAGGPVTVTHPEVMRYFMTIPEASQLILQAGALGQGGEIFILEMGTPIKIADMARDLIRLSGKEPDRDIEIRFDKLRPGEKLYEELITEGEGIVATEHEKILVLRANGCFDEHGGQDCYRKWLNQKIEELYEAAEAFDAIKIKEKLKEIVPEYAIQEAKCAL